MGLSETGAVALLFAATYPERTSAVIAYGSFAGEGGTGPVYPWVRTRRRRTGSSSWSGSGRGALYLEDFAPSARGDRRFEEWYAELERLSVSPAAAVALVTDDAADGRARHPPTIRVPTLVLHKVDDRRTPIAEGRYIADHVPGPTFVELEGADHWPWIGHEQAVEEIQEFLTGVRDVAEPDRSVATVMFIDVVDSTRTRRRARRRRWARSARGLLRGGTARARPVPGSGRSTRPATASS